ncbi:MAG: adenosylmethionine--8-amino-7-oxononanoate transaminase [Planctomycetota bacterium]
MNAGRRREPPEWVLEDRKHVWHPYAHLFETKPPLPIARARGAYLYTADGRKILDGTSSWWVNIHGHAHPRLNRALSRQAARFAQVIFAGCTHEPGARLAARLAALAPPGLDRVFYSDDGSTAVEVALKMAYQYWKNRGESGRNLFVALERAYHGETFGAMACGGVAAFRDAFRELLFEVRRAPAPACTACPAGKDRATCAAECGEDLEAILKEEGGRVAAVIVEPMVQGAGGMIVWPAEFLRRVRRATERAGTLLIADEVFTGFGRTGKLFACEHGPVSPDILCVSKALTGGYLPLAATLATAEVQEAFRKPDPRASLLHGHSFTGNALACAVALESLDMLEETLASGKLARLEALFAWGLERLRRLPAVLDARGIGAIAAVEVRPSESGGYLDPVGARLAEEILARGVLLRPLGNVLYFVPPYVIAEEDAERVFDILEEVLAKIPAERSRDSDEKPGA